MEDETEEKSAVRCCRVSGQGKGLKKKKKKKEKPGKCNNGSGNREKPENECKRN